MVDFDNTEEDEMGSFELPSSPDVFSSPDALSSPEFFRLLSVLLIEFYNLICILNTYSLIFSSINLIPLFWLLILSWSVDFCLPNYKNDVTPNNSYSLFGWFYIFYEIWCSSLRIYWNNSSFWESIFFYNWWAIFSLINSMSCF